MTGASPPVELRLPATLDLNAASPLATDLLRLRGQDIALIAEDVDRLGAQCLQVLLAAERRWTADGHRMVVSAPSAAFNAAMSLLGADTLLPCLSKEPSP